MKSQLDKGCLLIFSLFVFYLWNFVTIQMELNN